MDYKEVERLLEDKFYNAHTTCPEEQKLYDWLCSEECSEELFIDREIIRTYIQQHPPVDIPKDIELKMEVLIDQWADSEHQFYSQKIYPKWKYIAGTAAIAALVIGSLHFIFIRLRKGVYVDTCQTPEEAYVEVQKALSSNF